MTLVLIVLPPRGGIVSSQCAWSRLTAPYFIECDLAWRSNLDIVIGHECGGLPVIPNVQIENPCGFVMKVTAAGYVGTIDSPSSSFAAYYETIGDVGQKGGSECSNNSIVFVSADGLAPDEELDLAWESLLLPARLLWLFDSWNCTSQRTAFVRVLAPQHLHIGLISPIQGFGDHSLLSISVFLASPDRPSENVIVLAIVVPGLMICNLNIAYRGSFASGRV